MRPIFLLSLILLCSGCLLAQEGLGLNPPGMKWEYISTPSGNVIFPKGMDSMAGRVAAIMAFEKVHDKTITGKGATKRVTTILQSLSSLPAGFSTPAPWRNEFYLTPPQNMFLGPVVWMNGLTAHEYRHTQQFDAGKAGFTIPYRVLMGQTGWLLNTLFTQPLWFREGDAVLAETLLTQGGRGRLASFHMEYRAMRLAGYDYSYEKAHYNSFKNFIPNPYRIGYYMVTKARRDYGDTIWQNILHDVYFRKGFIYPFSRSLKDYTGYNLRGFYQATVQELDSIWSATDKQLVLTPARAIAEPGNHTYTNYRFPQYLPDSSVLVLKSSLDQINTYYIIDRAGKEHRLFSPGIYTEDHITTVVEGDKMVWAESAFDERWINRDYSIIKLYDFTRKKIRKLSSRSRYFSPAISRDGSQVVVCQTDTMSHYRTLVLDANTGKVLKTLPNPTNIFFTQPRWMADNVNIVCIGLSEKGNAILQVNTQTGAVKELLPYTYTPLSRPYPAEEAVYFSADYSGINNIYALEYATGKVYQVTSVRFGAFEPVVSANGKSLLFSEYTADGYRSREIALNRAEWRLLKNVETDIHFHQPREGRAEGAAPNWSDSIKAYPVKPYHALTQGLFNIYGWFPVPNIPEYGMEFYTKNIMSTLRGTLGLAYNTNESRFHHYARLSYAALYPVIDLQYNYGNRRADNIFRDSAGKNVTVKQVWIERTASAGVRLPFRLTQGTYSTNLAIGAAYNYYEVDFQDSSDFHKVLQNNRFGTVSGNIMLSRLRSKALRQVEPRWGQQLDLRYEKGLTGNARRLTADVRVFFPGLWRTHSLNLRLAYKEENVINTYRFADNFLMPKGYKTEPLEKLYLAEANYELPVWYPDIALGGLAFFQRVRLNAFYNCGLGYVNQQKEYFSAIGPEVFIDFRLFRLFQMSIALRYSYKLNSEPSSAQRFEFLVPRFELAN